MNECGICGSFDMRYSIKRPLSVCSQGNIKGCLNTEHQPCNLAPTCLKGVALKDTFDMKNLKMNLYT